MPQPRKYKTNADRQAAYRKRKARREALDADRRVEVPNQALVSRVMAAAGRAEA